MGYGSCCAAYDARLASETADLCVLPGGGGRGASVCASVCVDADADVADMMLEAEFSRSGGSGVRVCADGLVNGCEWDVLSELEFE